jgi:hypothetical protein
VLSALELATDNPATGREAALRLAEAFPPLRGRYFASPNFDARSLIVGERRALLREARHRGLLPVPAGRRGELALARDIVDSFAFRSYSRAKVADMIQNPVAAVEWVAANFPPPAAKACERLAYNIARVVISDGWALLEHQANGEIRAGDVAAHQPIRFFFEKVSSREMAKGVGSLPPARLAEIERDFRALAVLQQEDGPCVAGLAEEAKNSHRNAMYQIFNEEQRSSPEQIDAFRNLGKAL